MPKTITKSNGVNFTYKEDKFRYFFPKDYLKVFDCLKKKQQHTLVCQLNTGARINELMHVKVSDIDFVNRRLVLRVTKSKAKKGEEKGRGRMRTIQISTKFAKYLKGFIRENNLVQEDNLMILSKPAFNIGLKKACAKAGLLNPNDFSSHNIRKTLEVWLMALGVQDMTLVAHLGHDIRTAVSHYVSPSIFTREEKDIILEILDNLYEDERRYGR